MDINVVVAFSNNIFSEAIKRLLDDDCDDCIRTKTLEAGSLCRPETLETAQVVLTDFAALYSSFPSLDVSRKNGLILLDTDCGRDNIISAIVSRNLSGVLLGAATPAVLRKAVKAVARGEVWIDKNTVKDLLNGINTIKKTGAEVLSEKEKEVVGLVCKGLRNKEAAQRLRISELTVKTHLHRIFKKLNVKTRSQLITFALRNNLAGNTKDG